MVTIKMQCRCGQKYSFDVDLSEGGMAGPIYCPACGCDGGVGATEAIAQHLALNPIPSARLESGVGRQKPEMPPQPRRIPMMAAPRRNFMAGQRGLKSRKLLLGGAALATVLVGVIVFQMTVPEVKPLISLNASESGLPTTLSQLNNWYVEPPRGENAWFIYKKALHSLQSPKGSPCVLPFFGNGQLPDLASPVPEPMKSSLADWVKSNREALQYLAQGAQFERCRYPLDFTRGSDLVYRPFPKVETASLLLELSALYHADCGQGEQAAKDLVHDLALANSLGIAPATLAQLLRGRVLTYTLRGLEQVVNRSRLSPEAASQLKRAWERMEARDACGEYFNRSMAGERVMALAELANPPQMWRALAAPDLKMTAERRRRIAARLRSGEKFIAESEFFESSFQQLIAARQSPFPRRLETDFLALKQVEQADEQGLVVLDMVLPSLARRTPLEADCLARSRVGCTVVALEQFRNAHDDRYPARLGDLIPEYLSVIPEDPFDGQPLQYLRVGEGYTLASKGRREGIVVTVIKPAKR